MTLNYGTITVVRALHDVSINCLRKSAMTLNQETARMRSMLTCPRGNYTNRPFSYVRASESTSNYALNDYVRKHVKLPMKLKFLLVRCVLRTVESAIAVNYSNACVCAKVRDDFKLYCQSFVFYDAKLFISLTLHLSVVLCNSS